MFSLSVPVPVSVRSLLFVDEVDLVLPDCLLRLPGCFTITINCLLQFTDFIDLLAVAVYFRFYNVPNLLRHQALSNLPYLLFMDYLFRFYIEVVVNLFFRVLMLYFPGVRYFGLVFLKKRLVDNLIEVALRFTV